MFVYALSVALSSSGINCNEAIEMLSSSEFNFQSDPFQPLLYIVSTQDHPGQIDVNCSPQEMNTFLSQYPKLELSTETRIHGMPENPTEQELKFIREMNTIETETFGVLYLDGLSKMEQHNSLNLEWAKTLFNEYTANTINIRMSEPRLVKRLAPCMSLADCTKKTNNCSSHGTCQQKNGCYSCSCTVKKWTDDKGNPVKNYDGFVRWTGDSCQYQDISDSFQILFWLSVGLIVVTVFVIGMMVDAGGDFDETSGSSQRLKTE